MTHTPLWKACPTCGQRPPLRGEDRHTYGPFIAHPDCAVTCALCGKTITRPKPVTGTQDVAAWCGKPVHRLCKEAE